MSQAITRVAMQNLDNQIWKSRISISPMLKLYSRPTCILPIFLYDSECCAVQSPTEMYPRLMPTISGACGNDDVRRTTKQPHLSSSVQAVKHDVSPCSATLCECQMKRCQEDLNGCPFGELEETIRTPSYYVDENYPAGPEIQKPLPE